MVACARLHIVILALLFDDGSVTPEGDITETTAETEIWFA